MRPEHDEGAAPRKGSSPHTPPPPRVPPSASPFPETISPEEVNRLPLTRYAGSVRLVEDMQHAQEAVKRLARERVLGFDTETRAAFRKGEAYPPSLVQLAAGDAVYVFRLAALGGRLGGLEKVLANPRVVKAGVSVAYDLRELRALVPFEPRGFADLEGLSDKAGIAANGLRPLAAIVLGFRVGKGPKTSNWARVPLSPAQIAYAATDAWVCREIYLRLAGRGTAST